MREIFESCALCDIIFRDTVSWAPPIVRRNDWASNVWYRLVAVLIGRQIKFILLKFIFKLLHTAIHDVA